MLIFDGDVIVHENSKNIWDIQRETLVSEAVGQRCSVKKAFLEILQNSQENSCDRASFLIKLQTEACNFIKKRLFTTLQRKYFFKHTHVLQRSKRRGMTILLFTLCVLSIDY